MKRCGVDNNIYCEYRRKGQCENAQYPCPLVIDEEEIVRRIKRHLKGIEKAVEKLEKETLN